MFSLEYLRICRKCINTSTKNDMHLFNSNNKPSIPHIFSSFLHKMSANANAITIIENDLTDSDNYASIVDVINHTPMNHLLYIVLVGRRTNLAVPYIGLNGKNFAKDVPQDVKDAEFRKLSEQFEADPVAVAEDSKLVYMDAANRLVYMLTAVGLISRVTKLIVDPAYFIPQCTPVLSDAVHVLDFLFNRKDLFVDGQIGSLITPDEYNAKVKEIAAIGTPNAPCEVRREYVRALIRDGLSKYPSTTVFHTLADLKADLTGHIFNIATCFLLGPLSNATKVLELIHCVEGSKLKIIGQMFAFNNLNTKSFNIFLNQFNVDTDQAAALEFLKFVNDKPATVEAYFVPTEATKNNPAQAVHENSLMNKYGSLSPEEQAQFPVMQNWHLYTAAKKPGFKISPQCVPEPIFDVDATSVYNAHKDIIFNWIPVKINHKLLVEYEGLTFKTQHAKYVEGRLGFEMTTTEGGNMFALIDNDKSMENKDYTDRFTASLFIRTV